MSASFQEFCKRPIFAVKKILRAVGQNASGALTPSEGDAWRPPWVHEGIRERDTVVTCELELYDFFSRDSDALLLMTARPQVPGKSFPTTCIVSVTTNGQALDAQSVSREVVVKEWVMRSRHQSEDAAATVVVPVKTIVNLASIIDPRFSETSRVFLTLRFVGCCDASNMHCIKDVQLEYITPMQRRDPSVSSAHSNGMLKSTERAERRDGQLDSARARSTRSARVSGRRSREQEWSDRKGRGDDDDGEYVDDGRSSRCGCSRSMERIEPFSMSAVRNTDPHLSAGSSEVEVRVDLSPTPMKMEEREYGSERRRRHNPSPSPSSTNEYNPRGSGAPRYSPSSASRDNFYTDRSAVTTSHMLTPAYKGSVSVERKSLSPPEMDYNRETMKILAADHSTASSPTTATTGSRDLYGAPFRRNSNALAPSPTKQQEGMWRPWSARESFQGSVQDSHAAASRSSDYGAQESSQREYSRMSRAQFEENDADVEEEDDERYVTVIQTSPCGTPMSSVLHSDRMSESAADEEPRTPQLQKWSCEAASPFTGTLFDAGSEGVRSERAMRVSQPADIVYVVTDDDDDDDDKLDDDRRAKQGGAAHQSVRQMRPPQQAKPSATPSSIPSVRSPCSAGVSDEEIGNYLAAELLMPQFPARPASGTLSNADLARTGLPNETKQQENSGRGPHEPGHRLDRFSYVHESHTVRGIGPEHTQNRSSSPSVQGSSSLAQDDWRISTAPPKASFVSVRSMRRSESRRSALNGPWSAMAHTLGLGSTSLGAAGCTAGSSGRGSGSGNDNGLFSRTAAFTAVGYSEIEAKERRMKLERAKRQFRSTLGGANVYCAEDDTLGQVSSVLGVDRHHLLHPTHSNEAGLARKRPGQTVRERSTTQEAPRRHPEPQTLHPVNQSRKMTDRTSQQQRTPRDMVSESVVETRPATVTSAHVRTVPAGYTKMATPARRGRVDHRSLDVDYDEDSETNNTNVAAPPHPSAAAITPTRAPPPLPQQRQQQQQPPPPSSPVSPVPLAPERTSPRGPALIHTIRSAPKASAAAVPRVAASTHALPTPAAAKQRLVQRHRTISPDSPSSTSDADDDGYIAQGALQPSSFAAAGRSFAAHGWEMDDAASGSETDERSVATVLELQPPVRKTHALVKRTKHVNLRTASDDSFHSPADTSTQRGRFALRALPSSRTISSSDDEGYRGGGGGGGGGESTDVSDADTEMSLSLVVVEELSDADTHDGELVSVEEVGVAPNGRIERLRLQQSKQQALDTKRAAPSHLALKHREVVDEKQRPQITFKGNTNRVDGPSTGVQRQRLKQRDDTESATKAGKQSRPTSTAPPRRPPPSYIASHPQPRLLRATTHHESSDVDSSVAQVVDDDIAPLPSEPTRLAPIPLTGVFLVHKHHASRKGTGRRLLTLRREGDGSVVVSLKKLESKMYKLRIGGKKDGDGGSGSSSVAMTLSPSDEVTLLTGLQAYHSNVIHRDKVRAAECCAVITRRGQLVTAFEVFAERELEPIRTILASLHLKQQ